MSEEAWSISDNDGTENEDVWARIAEQLEVPAELAQALVEADTWPENNQNSWRGIDSDGGEDRAFKSAVRAASSIDEIREIDDITEKELYCFNGELVQSGLSHVMNQEAGTMNYGMCLKWTVKQNMGPFKKYEAFLTEDSTKEIAKANRTDGALAHLAYMLANSWNQSDKVFNYLNASEDGWNGLEWDGDNYCWAGLEDRVNEILADEDTYNNFKALWEGAKEEDDIPTVDLEQDESKAALYSGMVPDDE